LHNGETEHFPSTNVGIIIGDKSGFALQELAPIMPVWAPKTSNYEQVAKNLRETHPNTEITLYNRDASKAPEREFISWLPTIDLHHGEYSSETPWQILHVYGVVITTEITEALQEYGVEEFIPTDFGFRARRSK